MHPKFEIPTDPHGKHRYESAMKHVEAAKKAGKSSDEIHAIFKKVMEFNPMDIESIPQDEAHAKYRDLFFLMFFLMGINLVDLSRLTNIENGRVSYKRAKTGTLYDIKVEPDAQDIIERNRGSEHLISLFD